MLNLEGVMRKKVYLIFGYNGWSGGLGIYVKI